jgi:hypothetical protein
LPSSPNNRSLPALPNRSSSPSPPKTWSVSVFWTEFDGRRAKRLVIKALGE